MIVYRIAKTEAHARDISGMGAAKYGGRWNNKGTQIAYTSMNSSLAYLENLVHFDESGSPPNLYIAAIEIKNESLIYKLPDSDYPVLWQMQDNPDNKTIGDQWIAENKFLAYRVRSAINATEYNFLLNPLYPGYNNLTVINAVELLRVDARLIRRGD